MALPGEAPLMSHKPTAYDENEEKAANELEKEWIRSPFLVFLLVVCSVIARHVLVELVPEPSLKLVVVFSVIAVVNFCVKVVGFMGVRDAPRTKTVNHWPEKFKGKRVSVIFPAYNEADGIKDVVMAALNSTDSKDVEFIVVDDRSKDATWEILSSIAKDQQDSRFKPVAGKERGKVAWKGKNWSCAQGYEAATGDYLLFCDSDVTLHKFAVESFLNAMASCEKATGWISFVPKTRFSCMAEYLFNWPGTMIAQALIPDKVNSGSKTYAFGQCNLFERSTYERLGGHRGIGHKVAESHELAARAVELAVPMRCQLAYEHAELVWYGDFAEAWKGQQKSIRGRMSNPLPGLGRPVPRPVVALLATLFVFWQVLPWFLLYLECAKFVELSYSSRDIQLTCACLASVACSYLNRFLGSRYLGYNMAYWWIAPCTSSFLMAGMALRACRPDSAGRWGDSGIPEGFVLPRDVEKKKAS